MKLSVCGNRIGVGYPAETEDPLSILRAARAIAAEKLAAAGAEVSFAEDELAKAKVAKDVAARALRDLDAWLAAQELQR